ncbi:hypothetical protein D3C83_24100 [compost metagenome]
MLLAISLFSMVPWALAAPLNPPACQFTLKLRELLCFSVTLVNQKFVLPAALMPELPLLLMTQLCACAPSCR